MQALFAALLIAALPVRPIAEAKHLVRDLGHGRPLLLHFFASWCGACREEFPRLRPLLLELPARGVEVALVSIDRPEDREKAEQMVKDFRLEKLPALLLEAPDPEPVARAMGAPKWEGTLPATFLYDARGKLRRSFIGTAEPQALEAEIRKLAR